MSNETKREVFDELLEIAGNAMDQAMSAQYPSDENGCAPSGIGKAIRDILDPIEKRYDAALPDDLPVIPKAVGEWIKECKHRNVTLADTLCMEMRPENIRNWMLFKDGDVANDFDRAGYLRKQDLMASAWVLGIWRVEETGEIVKLEAEK